MGRSAPAAAVAFTCMRPLPGRTDRVYGSHAATAALGYQPAEHIRLLGTHLASQLPLPHRQPTPACAKAGARLARTGPGDRYSAACPASELAKIPTGALITKGVQNQQY